MFCSSQDGKGLPAAALRTAGTGFTFPGRSLLSRCPGEALPHPPTPSSHPSPASRSLPSAAGASLCLPPSLSKPDPVPWIYPLAFLLSRFGVASRPRSDKRSRHPQVTAGARPSPGCGIFLLAVVTILIPEQIPMGQRFPPHLLCWLGRFGRESCAGVEQELRCERCSGHGQGSVAPTSCQGLGCPEPL